MRMAPSVLLMKDNGAGLANQTKLRLYRCNGLFEHSNRHRGFRWWIQRQRKQIVLTLRRLTDRRSFGQGTRKAIRHKSFNRMHGDMVIVARIEQVPRQLRCMTPLITL